MIVSSWILSVHYIYNYVNAKNDYRLYIRWMQLTQEVPAKTDRVAGLSRAENRSFWSAEKLLFYYFHRILAVFLVIFLVVVNSLFFIFLFDVDWPTYVLFQTISICHDSYMVYWFLQNFYTINLSCIVVMVFFAKRFRFIAKRLERLNRPKSTPIDNRKLARLVRDHKRVELELLEINEFFKNFLGTNLGHFFFHGITLTMLAIDPSTNWRLSVAFLGLVAAIFIMIIYIQSLVASSVLNEVIVL